MQCTVCQMKQPKIFKCTVSNWDDCEHFDANRIYFVKVELHSLKHNGVYKSRLINVKSGAVAVRRRGNRKYENNCNSFDARRCIHLLIKLLVYIEQSMRLWLIWIEAYGVRYREYEHMCSLLAAKAIIFWHPKIQCTQSRRANTSHWMSNRNH